MEVATIGLDISKHAFHIHAVDPHGQVTSRQRLRRSQIISFFSSLSPCLVGIEACATAHHGWGWFYLSTVLDDFSRYIIAWKLCSTMKAEDVTATLDIALKASGLDRAKVIHRPRLLSDNGSSYIAADLAKWLDGQNMAHIRGAPYHPMTQGKIERWHQTLKNRILLENYYLPGDLEAQIETFVADYNHLRYHEGIGNLTPADVYFGRGQTILIERERIKRQTLATRRLLHQRQAA
jgi:RNA-directed DNA polymerase